MPFNFSRKRASVDASSQDSPSLESQAPASRSRRLTKTLIHHFKRHVGVGVICSVAYFDPGNWSVDLAAGSQFGYKLLFMVLMAGLGAVVLQSLACKMGVVTGLDLAQHSRLLLNNHPKYPRLVRWAVLYPLYALAEIAIISTDLAELIGSAIGLVLIFPRLPLPIAVLLTALDVFLILAFGDPSRGHGRPVRIFEFLIIILVLVVFICFVMLIVEISPAWGEVFYGFVPSKTLVDPDGMYNSIGIIGATIMPHALFLGSHLATQDRNAAGKIEDAPPVPVITQRRSFKAIIYKLFRVTRLDVEINPIDLTTPYGLRENNAVGFVKGHLVHGLTDIIMSLLGFAVAINSAILILAGAAFFYGPGKTPNNDPAGLFDAHDLLKEMLGKPFAFMFALALLCAGQSASITATLAGQIVSEGFINWTISPFLRRIITRLLGLIPAMVVAVCVGRRGIDTLLVISQVILSIVLPFVTFPLIYVTSSRLAMRVRKVTPTDESSIQEKDKRLSDDIDVHVVEKTDVDDSNSSDNGLPRITKDGRQDDGSDVAVVPRHNSKTKRIDTERTLSRADQAGRVEYVDYANGWPLTIISYIIWFIVFLANAYMIVTLAIGDD